MSTFIDKWGRPLTNLQEGEEAYMVDAATSGVTYICYDDAAKRIIRRITVANSVTTIEFSYGAWADRTTLTYVPINSSLEVTD